MDALILVGVLVVMTAWVAAPLYTSERSGATDDRDAARARLETLLAQLRELEVDHASGLVTDAGYDQQRSEAETEAAALARRVDAADADGTD